MSRKSITRSTRSAKRRQIFTCKAESGAQVFVAGSFNNWEQRPMTDRGNGEFSVMVMLEPGVYEYKFVINGNWVIDQENPNFRTNDLGSLNSVLTIGDK